MGYKPPKSVAKAAERGLELRKKAGGKGGLSSKQASEQGIGSGVQRAVNLKNRDDLSLDTVKRMKAFFDRHEKNAKIGKGKEPHEDKGYVAWLLWGGDPGRAWANKIVADAEKNESLRANIDRLRALTEGVPPQVKRCVAKVAPKFGGDTDRAFAICVSQMQKSKQIKKGSMELTSKGEKVAKSKAAKKDYGDLKGSYENLLKRNRKK